MQSVVPYQRQSVVPYQRQPGAPASAGAPASLIPYSTMVMSQQPQEPHQPPREPLSTSVRQVVQFLRDVELQLELAGDRQQADKLHAVLIDLSKASLAPSMRAEHGPAYSAAAHEMCTRVPTGWRGSAGEANFNSVICATTELAAREARALEEARAAAEADQLQLQTLQPSVSSGSSSSLSSGLVRSMQSLLVQFSGQVEARVAEVDAASKTRADELAAKQQHMEHALEEQRREIAALKDTMRGMQAVDVNPLDDLLNFGDLPQYAATHTPMPQSPEPQMPPFDLMSHASVPTAPAPASVPASVPTAPAPASVPASVPTAPAAHRLHEMAQVAAQAEPLPLAPPAPAPAPERAEFGGGGADARAAAAAAANKRARFVVLEDESEHNDNDNAQYTPAASVAAPVPGASFDHLRLTVSAHHTARSMLKYASEAFAIVGGLKSERAQHPRAEDESEEKQKKKKKSPKRARMSRA